jgi:outer membrane protein TolC
VGKRVPEAVLAWSLALALFSTGLAQELRLTDLLYEVEKRSPEVLASQSRAVAAQHKVPQVESLPDPMFMFGYQNEGRTRYTYGKEADAQWMFSASQMVPFPGKLALKGEMAKRDAEGLRHSSDTIRFKVVARVKELYYDLFLAYKDIDLVRDKTALFSRIEDAALARYASGKGEQQEVLMAQTEKYMLLEREEMLRQRVQSIEAMLNTTLGRDVSSPLGRPVEPASTAFPHTLDDLLRMAEDHSPEIRAKERMVASSEAKVKMARKEYFPDVTLNAGYFERGGEFRDMMSLTATVNLPIFYKTKQEEGVREAEASLSEARHELQATRLMVSSNIRDIYSMLKTADNLMELYKNGLLPKNYQDVQLAIAGYVTGKIEAITVISRLKALLDTEFLYWRQFVEREKAIARQEALTGAMALGS